MAMPHETDPSPTVGAWLLRQAWAAGPVLLMVLAGFATGTWQRGRDGLLVPAQWIPDAVFWAAVVWFAALAVAGVWTNGRRGPGAAMLVGAATLALAGGCLGLFSAHSSNVWKVMETVRRDRDVGTGSGGPIGYASIREQWLGDYCAIVRIDADGWLGWAGTIVAKGDLAAGFRLVRPRAIGNATGLVVRGDVVALLGVDGDCEVAVAKDGRPILGWTPADELDPAMRSRAYERRVTFALVADEDELSGDDVARIESEIAAAARDAATLPDRLPRDGELTVALGSANTAVRDAAARFVRAGGAKLYPDATAALAR